MSLKELEKAYVNAYELHFNVDYDKRTDETFKNVQKLARELYEIYQSTIEVSLKQLYLILKNEKY